MKRFWKLWMAGLAVLSLTACSASKPASSSKAPDPEPTQEPTEEPTPEPSDTPTPEAADVQYERGTVNGQIYSNPSLKLAAQLPDEWQIASEEELAQQSQITAENMTEEAFREMLENGSIVIDFSASGSGTNVNIVVQELPTAAYTAEQVMKAGKDSAAKQLEAQGFENVTVEESTVLFCNEEAPALRFYATYSGVDIFETQVYVQSGRLIAAVTAASGGEDRTDEILSYFRREE